jgi:hypothetical protein
VRVEETRGRVVVDERVVSEPFDRATVGTGVAEGALALESPRQSPPGSLVAGPVVNAAVMWAACRSRLGPAWW